MFFIKGTYLDTIMPRDDLPENRETMPEIGQRARLSKGDILQTMALYGCPGMFSVVSNFELLDARFFPLRKVCVRACSKFKIVIFCALVLAQCSNQSQILRNTCRTYKCF